MKCRTILLVLPLLALTACQTTPIVDPAEEQAAREAAQRAQQARQTEPEPALTPQPIGPAEPDPIYEEALREKAERERSIHLNLVEQMISQGNTYAALAHLDAYEQKWGNSVVSQRLRADSLRKTRQFDKAEVMYKSLLSTDVDGRAWYGLARVAVDQGNLSTAVPRFEKAINRNPLYVEAYADLGLVYLLLNNKQPAYDTLMKASQLSNNDPKIVANLGLWALVYEDFDMARDVADRLNWSEETRGQVLAQASKIRSRFAAIGAQP